MTPSKDCGLKLILSYATAINIFLFKRKISSFLPNEHKRFFYTKILGFFGQLIIFSDMYEIFFSNREICWGAQVGPLSTTYEIRTSKSVIRNQNFGLVSFEVWRRWRYHLSRKLLYSQPSAVNKIWIDYSFYQKD